MKGKHSLYSTTLGLIIFILIMVGVYSGVKTAFYMLFIPLILIFVVYLLFRYLQEVVASIYHGIHFNCHSCTGYF